MWSNLVMDAHMRSGQVLLIHGGGSGIGTHAIQVAKQMGVTVAVTAKRPYPETGPQVPSGSRRPASALGTSPVSAGDGRVAVWVTYTPSGDEVGGT